jgi:hypothetical protein
MAIFAITASAQKVYTGYIKFNKKGYTAVAENTATAQEKIEGVKFIKHLILQVYGKDALSKGLATDIDSHIIVVGSSQEAIESMNAYYKEQLKGKPIENTTMAIYSILKIKGAASPEAGGYSLIDLKNKVAYNLYDEKIIKL